LDTKQFLFNFLSPDLDTKKFVFHFLSPDWQEVK
jgi:hypothetical protein